MAFLFGLFAAAMVPSVCAEAAGTMFDSPYVTAWESATRKHWTIKESLPYTDYGYRYTRSGTRPEYWYESGTRISTGIPSSLRSLERGEHYYSVDRVGEVPVGYWEVKHTSAACIHTGNATGSWEGLTVGDSICYNAYYSGWFAYCADCGELLTNAMVYASRDAISTLDYVNIDYEYYYICPTCNHLENEGNKMPHVCRGISWNKYEVVYDKNATGKVNGWMDPSYHMYDNHTEYEGETITPVTRLTLNTYRRVGYTFAGWNTEPDGSGTFYADGAEILNLSEYDYHDEDGLGTVTLYAQWKKTESSLAIDPGEGTYDGKSGITLIHQAYGTTYTADSAKVSIAGKYVVSFDTNGGSAIAPMTAPRTFNSWQMSTPFYGYFTDTDNVYIFEGADGITDTLTATYDTEPVILPTPQKPNQSFGGWYEDPECTKPAGFGGDEYTPDKDTTLYAKWVELTLWSYDNYTANSQKGAVDLKWAQPDTNAKTYKLYRSSDGSTFSQIYTAEEAVSVKSVAQTFSYKGRSETYTVPYTGFYTLTADGAQGGAYGSYTGGNGGSVSAKFYLTAGEKLTITAGGQNGYNGGGSGSAYGCGGGLTSIVSDKKGTLLIAGGGGGASFSGNGLEGGSNTSLRADNSTSGASGMAGGGGGYVGGNAGEYEAHYHVNASGALTGNTDGSDMSIRTGGGCYTRQVTATETLTGTCSYSYKWVAGNTQTCGVCGQNAMQDHGLWKAHSYTEHNTGYHGEMLGGYWQCNWCGTRGFGWGTQSMNGLSAGTHTYTYKESVTYYTLSCGYFDGEILSSSPAYGGSSYVNSTYAVSSKFTAGDRTGNGQASIQSDQIGYMNGLSMSGVAAPDTAAPDAIDTDSVTLTAISASTVQVSFAAPKDNGTQYWWKAESYREGTDTLLCTSNITTNTLATGVRGYLYILDTADTRTVTAENAQNKGSLLAATTVNCNLTADTQYLHLAAVDVAGNVGPTTTIRVDKGTQDWPVITDTIQISGIIGSKNYGTVYTAADGTHYVRADGKTPFQLIFDSYLDGEARADYQIDVQTFAIAVGSAGNAQEYTTTLPCSDLAASSVPLSVSEFTRKMVGEGILGDVSNTGASRSNYGRKNTFFQCFTVPASYNGKTIVVTPGAGAGAGSNGDVVYSSWSKDVLNAIRIVADGEAPVVTGAEMLETMTEINRENGIPVLTLSAADDLSGVKEFTVTVTNLNTGMTKVLKPNNSWQIVIDFGSDDAVFNGDVQLRVESMDHVGNAYVKEYGVQEFSMTAEVCNAADHDTSVCKKGENALLHVVTYGYADRIVIELPEELQEGNEAVQLEFYYPYPNYVAEENVVFSVPLYCPAGSYTLKVHAYKNGVELIAKPAVLIITEESVTDDVRVRIR